MTNSSAEVIHDIFANLVKSFDSVEDLNTELAIDHSYVLENQIINFLAIEIASTKISQVDLKQLYFSSWDKFQLLTQVTNAGSMIQLAIAASPITENATLREILDKQKDLLTNGTLYAQWFTQNPNCDSHIIAQAAESFIDAGAMDEALHLLTLKNISKKTAKSIKEEFGDDE
jgi:arsenate reductase-like glutaredoxin family protein